MKQLTQQLKSGKMEILEVPFPALNRGYIMVRNHYSVISAGTEGKTVTDARKGYISKAKSRQKEVKQVIEMVKTNGLIPTYNLVMNKLEAPSPLGYSSAGEVIAIGEGVTNFRVGDLVACGGSTASHADIVSVPINLAVKVNPKVDLKEAAFTTLGSIAMQGIRQAECRIGENCLIIGMGIIGQITYKILVASGLKPIGIDVSDEQLELAKNAGLKNVYNRKQEGLDSIISAHSRGHGVDSVIITAGTSSLDPVEYAGHMARKKAKVVIVGAVPTGFSRANYYKKELELRMSSSYGPGRSDLNYEEKGEDYPIAYVRFTENRNMESIVDLLESKRLIFSDLISHTFDLDEAPQAYDMILERTTPFSGILIQYDSELELKTSVHFNKNIKIDPTEANVGFIGAGNFAQNMLLPNIKDTCNFIGVTTGRGSTAHYVADKYGFDYAAASADELILDNNVNTIIITTRHNLHAEGVIKSIQANKNVFVEKPLAMNEAELKAIKDAHEKAKQPRLMVGYNRRFAPAIEDLKKHFHKDQKKSIMIRVNSGVMPVDAWVNDPEIGGGRIIGEACHFIDLAMFLADSKVVSVSAESMDDEHNLSNTVSINLKMENGCIASVNYYANGNKEVPKEFVEVFGGGMVVQMEDFKTLRVYGKTVKVKKYKDQDKGHAKCIQTYLTGIKSGSVCPISFEELYNSTLATLKVNQSIIQQRKIEL
ncbi:bi-domain-containing oxidoreductase [Schleiferiaceae bacterium]|jgi:polar amino acid transport system substrate-binding protein|nr:bi-domain-containing oxidoreductase [Schleiferiaceae bacterium]